MSITTITTINPGKFFLAVSLIFGICFILLTPPFQVPDEFSHFFRAWQISEGRILSEKTNNRAGGELPLSLEKIALPFYPMLYSGVRFRDISIDSLAGIPENNAEKKFYDFN